MLGLRLDHGAQRGLLQVSELRQHKRVLVGMETSHPATTGRPLSERPFAHLDATVSSSLPEAFFAYPSRPSTLPEVIRNAATQLNNGRVARFHPWEDLTIGGKFIITEICKKIASCDLFCADLTGINPNVMFEL